MGMGRRSRLFPHPRCRLRVICGQHLTIQPGRSGTPEMCPSQIGQSTLTVHQYSLSGQEQGLASSSSVGWSKLDLAAAWPSFKLLGALAVPSVDSVTEQQMHPRDILDTEDTPDLRHVDHILLPASDSTTRKRSIWWLLLWATRGQFTNVFWSHFLQPNLRGATEQRLREEPRPSGGLCVMLIEAGCTRPGLRFAAAVPRRGTKAKVWRAAMPF